MKRQVSDRPACVECRRLHRGCPGQRPCQRCVSLHIECIESVDNRTKKARSEHRTPLIPLAAQPIFGAPPSWIQYEPQAAQTFCFGHEHAQPEPQPQHDGWSGAYDVEAWERALLEPAPQYMPAAAYPYFAPEPHPQHPYAAFAAASMMAPPQPAFSAPEPLHSTPAASPRSSEATEADSPRAMTPDGEFFRCPVADCDHVYRRKGDLKTHVLQRHKDRPDLPLLIAKPRSTKLGKPFPCTIGGCPSGFTRKSGLARHLRQKHEGEPESKMWLDLHGQEDSDSGTPGSPSSPFAMDLVDPFVGQYETSSFAQQQQQQSVGALY